MEILRRSVEKRTHTHTHTYTHTHTALAPCAPRCALAWGFAAVKGVGNGLLRVRLRLLLRVGNVKGAVCGTVWGRRVRRTCAGWLTDVCEDVEGGCEGRG